MNLYDTLFTEIDILKLAIRDFKRGLIVESELKERLVNISVIVDYLITERDQYKWRFASESLNQIRLKIKIKKGK